MLGEHYNFHGNCYITVGNHNNMPQRDASYLSTDERGHIEASSLGGTNTPDNVVAQSKDLNHGGYLSMEKGERAALKNGSMIETDKTGYVSNQPGNRVDAFMVNDSITYTDGQTQNVHLSFSNMTNAEQEGYNAASMTHASDMLEEVSNPGDSLRASMSDQEYTNLMETTDATLPNIDEMYGEWISSENTEIECVSDYGMDTSTVDFCMDGGMGDMGDEMDMC